MASTSGVVATVLAAAVAAVTLIAYERRSSAPIEPPEQDETTQAAVDLPVETTPPAPPSFDLVRVAPDGAAMVAGRATPGAAVTIYADGAPVADIEADAAGDFVAIFDAPPSQDPQALTLGFVGASGERAVSQDVVVLLPKTPVADGVGVLPAPDPGSAGAVAPAPTVAAAAILRGGGAEVVMMEDPPFEGLTLASVSYGDTGEVFLAGRGDAGGRVRVYLDDAFARDAAVDASGRWSVALVDVTDGLRTLRIDAVGTDGAVTDRLETPFQRATPPASDDGGPVTVTVQPGASLWTLARIHYGAGVRYTQIHMANRALIRDPDLIYPGQIFVVPDPSGPAAD